MKKLLIVFALSIGIWAPVKAQGTYSNEGAVVDNVKAAVAAYLSQDWDAYRSVFADTAAFYPSQAEAVTLDQNIESHMEVHSMMENIEFLDPVYGVIENDGETWGVTWGLWSGTVKGTGEQLTVPVHISILHVNGKGVLEYGFWDNAPMQKIAAAMEADM